MNAADLARLLLLAAIWSGSFLFMKIASPVLGPAYLAYGRGLFAALFLFFVGIYLKKNLHLLSNWKHFLIVALFNSAIPSVLFGYSALVLSTAQLSILSATSPLWAFLIGLAIGNEVFSAKRLLGVALCIIGVFILFGSPIIGGKSSFFIAVLMGLGAAFSYGIATNYAKKDRGVDSFDNAQGSMWASVLLLTPALFFIPLRGEPTLNVWVALAAIGVIGGGVAYLLFFKLIEDLGAASALTVTYLVPVFGAIWGALFLGEGLTVKEIIGMAIILYGTSLVTEFQLGKLFNKNK